jgi:hypothetical protein
VIARELLATLGTLEIAGGAVYDALVGAVAVEHGLTLMTSNRRAADTYRRLDVKFVLVECDLCWSASGARRCLSYGAKISDRCRNLDGSSSNWIATDPHRKSQDHPLAVE